MTSPIALVSLLAEWLVPPGRWAVLVGDRGTAKSPVPRALARALAMARRPVACVPDALAWWGAVPPWNGLADPAAWLWLVDEWRPWLGPVPSGLSRGVAAMEISAARARAVLARHPLPGRLAWVVFSAATRRDHQVAWRYADADGRVAAGVLSRGSWGAEPPGGGWWRPAPGRAVYWRPWPAGWEAGAVHGAGGQALATGSARSRALASGGSTRAKRSRDRWV